MIAEATDYAPVWVELLRASMVGLAGVILGMAAYVVVMYWRRVAHGDTRALPRHIATVATSYCLLIIVTAGTQLELMVADARPTWRIPLLIVAYSMGVWSLRLILIHVERRKDTPRRRASDPG